MGTRSAIGYFENNVIHVTYCHYDGYYEGVGMTLYKHYNKDRLAYPLSDLGYISALRETIKEIKDTSEQIEALVPIMFATPAEFIKEATVKFWEYLYLWDTNYLQWFATTIPHDRWRPLQDILEEISMRAFPNTFHTQS